MPRDDSHITLAPSVVALAAALRKSNNSAANIVEVDGMPEPGGSTVRRSGATKPLSTDRRFDSSHVGLDSFFMRMCLAFKDEVRLKWNFPTLTVRRGPSKLDEICRW